MASGPGPNRRSSAETEAKVLAYVWQAWREQCAGRESQLEWVRIHLLGITDEGGEPSVHVEWSSEREVGHPRHVLRRPIPLRPDLDPDDFGDEIVWALWATAHGTS